MAAKKKKKAGASARAGATKKKKKVSKAVKAKKTPAKKSPKKSKAKPSKKAKKVVKAAAKKAPAKKTPAKKKKQIVGEGDYAASKSFDKDQASFVAKNKAKIPALGQEAEKALDGPEGDALREAEATAAGHSRDNF
jgi:hypothetical protein